MSIMSENRRPRGFTVLEVMISTSIFAAVMLIALLSTTVTAKSIDSGVQFVKPGIDVTNVLDGMSLELTDAYYPTTTVQTTSYPNCGLSFEKVVGYNKALNNPTVGSPKGVVKYNAGNGTATTSSTIITTSYSYFSAEGTPDGIDNNKNGYIDEGQIVRQESNGAATVILDNILGCNIWVGQLDHVVYGTSGTGRVQLSGFTIEKGVAGKNTMTITIRKLYLGAADTATGKKPVLFAEFKTNVTVRN